MYRVYISLFICIFTRYTNVHLFENKHYECVSPFSFHSHSPYNPHGLQPSCVRICCPLPEILISLLPGLYRNSVMKRRLQIILLLWSCILMQVVPVIPHHHHAEMLCLHHDAETSHQASSPKGCSSGCITHFNLNMPSERLIPHDKTGHKTDTDRIFFLCGELLFPEPETYVGHTFFHTPSFYESHPSGGTGLRAPPCPSFS